MPDPGATQPLKLWALVVGIDRYASPSLRRLAGCANDAQALAAFLVDRLQVPAAQVLTLTDGEATRAGIIQAFRTHLIDNPAIPRGAQLLFAYSGHGSRMATADPRELDGYNETLVPADARTVDPRTGQAVRDLPDKTLAALIRRLAAAKGDQITVLLDCCHSGSGSRDPEGPGALGERRAEPDERPAPADLDEDIVGQDLPRGAGPSGWAAGGVDHVLLAGCRDGESSYEYRGPEQVVHGAMTYFLLQELQQLRPDTSYADLHERVAAKVNGIYRNQLPQCEGDRTREVFGGARLSRDPFLTVAEAQPDRVRLAAGLVHGLGPGARLLAYPPELRTKEERERTAPIATLIVTEVAATSAWASIEPDAGGTRPVLPALARVVVTERGTEGLAQRVAVAATDAAMAAEVDALRDGIGASPHLVLVAEAAGADLRVEARAARFHVYGQGGDLLVDPASLAGAGAAVNALEVIARSRALEALRNRGRSSVQGNVRLRLRQFRAASRPQDMPLVEPGAGNELTLRFEPDAADANRYVLEVENASPLALYPHVFYLGTDFSIVRLYPRAGEVEAIPAGRTGYPRKSGGDAALFRVNLAPDEAASRDRLQVVLTAQPVDLAILEQPGVMVSRSARGAARSPASALERLVDSLGGGAGGRREVLPDEAAPGDDWGVAQLGLTVVRATAPRALPADGAPVDLGQGVTLRGPAGLGGAAALRTAGAATRGDDGPAVAPPPGLSEPNPALPPVTVEAVRGAGSNGLVLDLEVDEATRALVTAKAPLVIGLPPAAVEGGNGTLAVAFDGEDYLLAGVSAPGEPAVVTIPRLPPTVAPQAGEAGERGVGNLVRFFLYKKVGVASDELGLRRVVLGADGRLAPAPDGSPTYERPSPAAFRPGQKAALIVHGFSADSKGMAREMAPWLQAGAGRYDHLLTFDYETFGTAVAQNGAELAGALREQCGLGPADGITLHVFAHSMGCLVTRCMVELSGGDAFVDRVVLAGGPNRGTPWANTARGITYWSALLLNRLSVGTPAGLLSVPLELIYEDGTGWADIENDSAITHQLNALTAHDGVPYLVLAGNNSAAAAAANQAQRLAAKTLGQTLESFFGESNDTVIGRSSMRGVRDGAYPHLTVAELTCDHGGYYGRAEGIAAIRRWSEG
jgi:hypothetical protein